MNPKCYTPLQTSSLRTYTPAIEGGQWSVLSVHDQQEYWLSLAPGWVKEGAFLSLSQAYAIVTPAWTLMLSDFDRLCELLMGGSALHPDPEIRLRLLIALGMQVQNILGVVQSEIVAVKDQAALSSLWLSTAESDSGGHFQYRCAAEVRSGHQVVSGFMAMLVSRSAPKKIFSNLNQNHFQFSRFAPTPQAHSNEDRFRRSTIPLALPITLGAIELPLQPDAVEEASLITGGLYAFIATHLDESGKWTFPMKDFNLSMDLGSEESRGVLTLENTDESLMSRLADIPQYLEVRVGQVAISYAELLLLKQGQALKITGLAFPKVQLFSMNQCVAVGELVSCDDQVYVQILDIVTRGEHE